MRVCSLLAVIFMSLEEASPANPPVALKKIEDGTLKVTDACGFYRLLKVSKKRPNRWFFFP